MLSIYQFMVGLMEMEESEFYENILLHYALLLRRRRLRREGTKKARKIWVKHVFQQRRKKGAFTQLIKEMRRTDREEIFQVSSFSCWSQIKLIIGIAWHWQKAKARCGIYFYFIYISFKKNDYPLFKLCFYFYIFYLSVFISGTAPSLST